MANFCTNCGSKLEENYNYCINCGAKVEFYSNQYSDNLEKRKAKKELKRVVGGSILSNAAFDRELIRNGLPTGTAQRAIRQQLEKEIDSGQLKWAGVEFRAYQLVIEYKIKYEEEKKIAKMIHEILESYEIKSEISEIKIDGKRILSIKNNIKNKVIDKKENMSEDEIKSFIKEELNIVINNEKARIAREREKARIEKEKEEARLAREEEIRRKEAEWIKIHGGGYCGLDCPHCYEEFLDSHGAIVGDFDSEGFVEYYCGLGHTVSFGSYCKDAK